MKNQKGITLIELLATITILSIIGILIWNVFIQGNNFSKNEMTRNQLTQEANIVIAALKKNYQELEQIKVNSEGCSINLFDIKGEEEKLIATFGNKGTNTCYELYDEKELINKVFYPKQEGTLENSFYLKIYETDFGNKAIIPFRLSRLKEGANVD